MKSISKIKTTHHISICHTILESSIPGSFADISFELIEVCPIKQKQGKVELLWCAFAFRKELTKIVFPPKLKYTQAIAAPF